MFRQRSRSQDTVCMHSQVKPLCHNMSSSALQNVARVRSQQTALMCCWRSGKLASFARFRIQRDRWHHRGQDRTHMDWNTPGVSASESC
eukprot:4669369-Amphidinium_carterae.2